MSPDVLASLARGEAAALLQSVRLAVGQTEVYGTGEVAAYFRAHPVDLEGGTFIFSSRHVAMFGADVALVADNYDGFVARLWLVGLPYAGAPEPHVDVPFQLEMSQVPAHGLLGQADDHLFLPPSRWQSVEKAAAQLESDVLSSGGSVLSARPIALRAFGDAQRTGALFAVHVKAGADERRIGFDHAAVLIEHGEPSRIIRDPGTTRPWRPRIQA